MRVLIDLNVIIDVVQRRQPRKAKPERDSGER